MLLALYFDSMSAWRPSRVSSTGHARPIASAWRGPTNFEIPDSLAVDPMVTMAVSF